MADWNELCYILKESLPSNTSEQLYELKVIQAFEKLGWSQYGKEISVRESIQFGAANRIHPDIIIRSRQGLTHFVVEIKRPSEDLREERFRKQLHSYMRMLKVNLGILIGDRIQVFVDGSLMGSENIVLVEEIEFEMDSEKGDKFTGLFRKENYSKELIETYIDLKLKKKRDEKELKRIKDDILDLDSKELMEILKSGLSDKYDSQLLDKALEGINLELTSSKSGPDLGSKEYLKQRQEQFRYIPTKQKFAPRTSPRLVGEKPTKDGMKIGAYVQKTIGDLFRNNQLSQDMLDKLQSESYCKLKLNQNLKVLRTVAEGTIDHTGRNRYYTRDIYGGKYYLTAQWHQAHWELFLNWEKEVKSHSQQ